LLSALLGGALIVSVFLLYQRWNEMFWLYAWGLICVVTVFFSMFYSEWIVPLFNKQTPLAPGVLREAIEQFARKNDFAVSDIYVIDGSKRTTKANAYFTGLGRKKRVVLYDTLLKELTTEEIVAVLAHEIGHYKHRHVYISLLFSLLNSFVLLYVFSLLVDSEVLAHAMGGEAPTFELGLIAFTLLYSPVGLVIGILFNIFLRRNEYQADRYAAEQGLAQPLVSGLKKISVKALSNMTPDTWYVFVYYSHPTLLQRINRLQSFITTKVQNQKF
jgi:Zn-dependent protease with chaperone function